jgi:D-alanyl-D-alanine carboxypeptidase (penicillin-binding protein 5/6)
MSRELITRYPDIFNYTTIWMEDITHVTRQGESTFTLSSTNKLLRQYTYANGLKTGSTNKAKYCLSATALKDNIQLIAVVMAAPDYKVRFQDAQVLLNYGFAKTHYYEDDWQGEFAPIQVRGAVDSQVSVAYESQFRYLDLEGNDLSGVTKEDSLPQSVDAPVKKGDKVGETVYYLGEKKLGSVDIVATEDVEKAGFRDYFRWSLGKWLLGTA